MDKKIVIEGSKVHGVGYRPLLFEKARMMRLERFMAENVLENGKEVLIVSFGGRDKAVLEFAYFCRTARPQNAVVSGVREEQPPGDILPIGEYEGILASGQQRKIVETGLEMLSVQKETVVMAKQTLALQDETLGMQKESLGVVRENLVVSKESLGVSKKSLDEAGKGVSLQEKTVQKLDVFHKDNVQSFDHADEKFDKIVVNIERILEEMKEERMEARKSTERIIAMIAGMRTGGAVMEEKAVYGSSKKGKKKK